jgi:hypothetical protein
MYPITGQLLLNELDEARRRDRERRRFVDRERIERPARRDRVDVWLAIASARRFATAG